MQQPTSSFHARVSARLADPNTRQTIFFSLASVIVGLTLFLPRPQNFAPIGALGLFAGAYAKTRYAWLFPLGALALHTVAMGGYHWVVLTSVYLGFAVPGLIGRYWLGRRVRPWRIGVSSLGASLSFFLISNLGSWIGFGIPRGESLLHHYMLGIPFFWNTLCGDLFFSTVLFGGSAVAATWTLARLPERAVQ